MPSKKSADEALMRLEEEITELRAAIASGDHDSVSEEIGDVLFSAVNVSRLLKTDAEEALYRGTDKFIGRFERTEDLIRLQGKDMKTLSIDELDVYWQKAKN